ncbi:MAG: acetolactate synthase small subunit, partial [bacterium]|nr:acetolactate synthase small subunit [bacterium]
MRHTLSALVENEFGVLARVATLISAKGYNIDSLSVSTTKDPSISRITIVTQGSDAIILQITKQLNRLINVLKVEDLTHQKFVVREMILVKIK